MSQRIDRSVVETLFIHNKCKIGNFRTLGRTNAVWKRVRRKSTEMMKNEKERKKMATRKRSFGIGCEAIRKKIPQTEDSHIYIPIYMSNYKYIHTEEEINCSTKMTLMVEITPFLGNASRRVKTIKNAKTTKSKSF